MNKNKVKYLFTEEEAYFIDCAIQKERFLKNSKLSTMQHTILQEIRGAQKHYCSRCKKLSSAWLMVLHEYHDGHDWYCRYPCWEDLEDRMMEMHLKMTSEKIPNYS